MATPRPTAQPAAERRAAEAEVRRLVAKFSPTQSRLVAAVRRAMRKRLPTAHEVVYEYRDCFVISLSPNGHGYAGVFAIRGSAEDVRLYFTNGKGLPDPDKVLQGSANARWVPVEGPSALTRPAVARLIELAIDRNRVPFARTGRGPVVLSPTLAKKK